MITKNRIKNYLKLGIFLFGISLILTNCLNDTITDNKPLQNGISVKKISLNDFKQKKELKKELLKFEKHLDYYKKETKLLSKISSVDSTFSILTDEIVEVITDSTEAYTFRIEIPTHTESTFENFVIERFNNQDYKFYIYRYKENTETGRFSDYNEDVYVLTRELIDSSQIDINDFNDYIAQKIIYDETTGCLFSLETSDCCEFLTVLQCSTMPTDGGNSGGGNGDGSGDSGSDSGSHTNGNGNSGSSNIGVLSNSTSQENDPCNKVLRNKTNNPTLTQELQNLKNLIPNASTERGKYKLSSSNIIQNAPVGVNGEVQLIIPTGNQKYEMIAHTHNSPATNTYSVFSFADLDGLSQLLRKGKIDANNFVAYLITADGTNYALTIDNPTQFLNTFAIVTDDGFDINVATNRVSQERIYYDNSNLDPNQLPLIRENNTNNLNDEKYFLDFLDNTNMGLTLFELDDNLEKYKKVKHNPITGDIDKTNCN